MVTYNPRNEVAFAKTAMKAYGSAKTGLFGALFEHMVNCKNKQNFSRNDGIGHSSIGSGLQFINKKETKEYINCLDSTDETEAVESPEIEFSFTPVLADDSEDLKAIHTQSGSVGSAAVQKTELFMKAFLQESKEFPDDTISRIADTAAMTDLQETSFFDTTRYGLTYSFPSTSLRAVGNKDIENIFDTPAATTRLLYKLMYGTTVQVQYLAGYGMKEVYNQQGQRVGTRPCFSSPIWRPLTEAKLTSIYGSIPDLQSPRAAIVCRLKKVNIPELNLIYPESLCLPIYHEHFIISESG